MNGWPHDQYTPGFHHGLHDMELPAPVPVGGMGASHALDQDALLEALVFMDDLDLDAGELAAIKHEPPPQMTTMGPFTGALESLGVIPAEAYAPGMLMESAAPVASTSMMNSVQDEARVAVTASMSPSPSPSPSSPPVSVTSSASPPVSPSAVSETKSTASTKPKGVVNRSRNRRREELNYLRSMVGELEDRLTTLRKRADEQQEQEHKRLGDESTTTDDPVLTAVWEDLATRQYAQRQRAEVENTKLRRMLEDQIQVGKSLERLLKRRNNVDDVDVTLTSKRPRRASVSSAWNNAAIFDELLGNLPGMYDELATVYSKLNFDRNPSNFRDITVRNDPEMGVMLEVTEARVFPFDYELTVQEFWTLFMIPTENERFHYHDTDCGDHVLKVQFGVTVTVARSKGEFNMKIVSQRYVEANRTVVVWSGLCDPTEISETNMDGVYMRHRGWNIIEPLTPSSDGTEHMGARITSYSYAVPEAFEDVPDQKRKVGTFTNFMLSTADMQINARQQQLENRLVELSRGR